VAVKILRQELQRQTFAGSRFSRAW